jgi:cellulose synthase/poly-beta-1,6-N-acetylglucosamine synthase-like glycosyltransferase
LTALIEQTRQPDHVVVIADNCTDSTVEVAEHFGRTSPVTVDVVQTVGNKHKKAGALNQALAGLLPTLNGQDVVLIQDADSDLDKNFIASGLGYVEQGYGGVGGVFRGSKGGGFVGHLQRNEYARYARDVARLGGKCLVITGTAALLRVGVLREISQARLDGEVPRGDGDGGVYDTTVLTEDNELTFALLHLGHKVISPAECTLTTEVMESWKELWKQRLRWKRGAIENCFQYGLTKITWKYWGRQLFTFLGVLVSAMYLSTILVSLFGAGIHIRSFWLWISLIFVVERVVTVRYQGWRQMLLSALMYELILDYYLQLVHAKAYADALFRKTKVW